MIAIGKTVPDATFQVFHEETIRAVTLNEFRGQWLILMFYPGDFTFVCPTELSETAKLYPQFKKTRGSSLRGEHGLRLCP